MSVEHQIEESLHFGVETGSQSAGNRKLSRRQSQVLSLAANGLTDRQIAQHLNLSTETVLSHWKRLRTHFGTSSRTEIVARVLGSSTDDRIDELTEERKLLLFELAEKDRLQVELQELNRRLEAEVTARAELMMRALADYERKHAVLIRRNAYLEKFHEEIRRFGLVPHIGEYGASFQKHWVGETLDVHGHSVTAWVDGSANIFDFTNPQDLITCIRMFDELEPGANRVLAAHRFSRMSGEVRALLDFIELDPLDESGVGQCHVWSVDVTDWIPQLREKIAQGWPDLPLQTSARIE